MKRHLFTNCDDTYCMQSVSTAQQKDTISFSYSIRTANLGLLCHVRQQSNGKVNIFTQYCVMVFLCLYTFSMIANLIMQKYLSKRLLKYFFNDTKPYHLGRPSAESFFTAAVHMSFITTARTKNSSRFTKAESQREIATHGTSQHGLQYSITPTQLLSKQVRLIFHGEDYE